MRQYELLYILPPTFSDDEVGGAAGRVSEILTKNGAQITQEVDLGKKRLAYPIKKHQYGYYRLLEVSIEPTLLQRVSELLTIAPEVVRHQVVVKPIKSPAVIEREQALRARLAAKRAQRRSGAAAMSETATMLSAEEIDKKLDSIADIAPEV